MFSNVSPQRKCHSTDVDSPIRTTPHSPGRLTRTCKHILHAMCLALCKVCYMNHIQQIPKLYYYPIDGRKGPEKVSLCDLGANCLSGKLKFEMLTPSGSLFEVCTKQLEDCPTMQLLCKLTGCCSAGRARQPLHTRCCLC